MPAIQKDNTLKSDKKKPIKRLSKYHWHELFQNYSFIRKGLLNLKGIFTFTLFTLFGIKFYDSIST